MAKIPYKKFNPNFHHLKESLRNDDLRFIFLCGGSSSGKSFSVAQVILLDCISNGSNTMVFRKIGATIDESIYNSFKAAAIELNIFNAFEFISKKIKCKLNGSYITFKGLDESEKIKGLESYKYVLCEELTDFDEADFKQIRKRLRGKKGQKIISTFNPISEEHWIKKNIFDKDDFTDIDNHLFGLLKDCDTGMILPKEFSEVTRKQVNSERYIFNPRKRIAERHPSDTLVIKSTYLNNFWVVGSPCGTYGFYDRQTVADFEKDKERDPNYYSIYALGEWGTIKTGGEYLSSYNPGIHRTKKQYISELPIHISIDNNILPYISVSFWQYKEENGKNELFQFHEICAEDPLNTASKAGEATRLYLESLGYNDVVYIYGDASTKTGNTIDDEKRSFFDKFTDKLEETYIVEDRIPKSNPSVSMSGEFINAIFSGQFKGTDILIDERCSKSSNDYEKVKKDVNGGILKLRIKNKATGQTYEEYGHLTDTMRYVVVSIFKKEYDKFSNRRKRNSHKEEDMKYFNVNTEVKYSSKICFVIPDCNGKSIIIIIGIHDYYDIVNVSFCDSFNEGYLSEISKGIDYYVFECNKSYIPVISKLREDGSEVRGRNEETNKIKRIAAYEPTIKEKFRFRSDYEEQEEYVEFMNNIMDYNGKDNFEALNALSCAASHLIRLY